MNTYLAKVQVLETDNTITYAPIASTMFGVCNNFASVSDKVVTFPEFDNLVEGVTIYVKFTRGNDQTNGVTLTVGLTNRQNVEGNCVCSPGEIIGFTYDKTNSSSPCWRVISTGISNAIQTYIDNTISTSVATPDVLILKGTVGVGGVPGILPIAGYETGWTYIVTSAGTYANQSCDVGDFLIAIQDASPSQNQLNPAHWTVIQKKVQNTVQGPADVTNAAGHVVIFDNNIGSLLADSGFTIESSVPANAQFTDTTYSVDNNGLEMNENNQIGIVYGKTAGTVAEGNDSRFHSEIHTHGIMNYYGEVLDEHGEVDVSSNHLLRTRNGEIGLGPAITTNENYRTFFLNQLGLWSEINFPVTSVNGQTGEVQIQVGDLGIGAALHFIGVLANNSAIPGEDSSENPIRIQGISSYTPHVGDVIFYETETDVLEYVYTDSSNWEQIGSNLTYKVTQSPVAGNSTDGNNWVHSITQDRNGNIQVQYTSLDSTNQIWYGSASKLGTSTVGSNIQPIYLDDGSPVEAATYAGGTSITLNGIGRSAQAVAFYAPTDIPTSQYQILVSGARTIANQQVDEPYWTPAATLQSEIKGSGNVPAYTILTLGNNSNASTLGSSEGKIVLYSSSSGAHILEGSPTSTGNYTHIFQDYDGYIIQSEYDSSVGMNTESNNKYEFNSIYVDSHGIVQAITYTPNLLYYASAGNSFGPSDHYIDDNRISINSASWPQDANHVDLQYNLYVNGPSMLDGSLLVNDISTFIKEVYINSATNISLDSNDIPTAAALIVEGGVIIKQKLHVNDITTINSTLLVSGSSTLTGRVGIGGAPNNNYQLFVNGNAAINTTLKINGSTGSTSTQDGALTVTGGVGIGENLNVGGNTSIAGSLGVNTLTVTSTSTLTGNVGIGGSPEEDSINNLDPHKLIIYGSTLINSSNQSIAHLDVFNDNNISTYLRFYPETNNLGDIGLTSNRWKNGYFSNLIDINNTDSNHSYIITLDTNSGSAITLQAVAPIINLNTNNPNLNSLINWSISNNSGNFIIIDNTNNGNKIRGTNSTWEISTTNEIDFMQGGTTAAIIKLTSSNNNNWADFYPANENTGSIGIDTSKWQKAYFSDLISLGRNPSVDGIVLNYEGTITINATNNVDSNDNNALHTLIIDMTHSQQPNIAITSPTPNIIFNTLGAANALNWELINDQGIMKLQNLYLTENDPRTLLFGTEDGFVISPRLHINPSNNNAITSNLILYVNGTTKLDGNTGIGMDPDTSNANNAILSINGSTQFCITTGQTTTTAIRLDVSTQNSPAFGTFYPADTLNGNLGIGGANNPKRWGKLYIGTADTYGDSYSAIYWNDGVPEKLEGMVQRFDFSFTNNDSLTPIDATITISQEPAYKINTETLQIVITQGMELLHSAISATTTENSLVLSARIDHTDSTHYIAGYILTSRGCTI